MIKLNVRWAPLIFRYDQYARFIFFDSRLAEVSRMPPSVWEHLLAFLVVAKWSIHSRSPSP